MNEEIRIEIALKGHGFSRAIDGLHKKWALASEGMLRPEQKTSLGG
jgi:hypothetical protein